jgi:cyanophycinase-like exopeptidase
VSVRAFALLGSGEFDPWTEPVDRWLVERPEAPGDRLLILPTASAAEGDAVFDTWGAKGLYHYRALDISADVVPLKTRGDAARQDLIASLDGAAAVYFSGGNPAYLASVLADTPFWAAVMDAMDHGLAYAGCSAGVACLGDMALDSAQQDLSQGLWQDGLRMFSGHVFGPHWDALDRYVPGLRALLESSVPAGSTMVAIDEDTAMTGDGMHWTVAGHGGVHVLQEGGWTDHASGDVFDLPMRDESRG